MDDHPQNSTIRRVMVGTDRSKIADHAVRWAAQFAGRYGAELFVVQVILSQHRPPQNPAQPNTPRLPLPTTS